MNMREKIESELDQIMEKHAGVLHPQHIVTFAKNPKTALHSRFEWDDGSAAEKYRIDQARQIIRVFVEVSEDNVTRVRAFVSLPSDREAGGGYRKTTDVMSEVERRAELLRMAIRDLQAFKRKYAALEQLAQVFAAADSVTRPKKNKRVRNTG